MKIGEAKRIYHEQLLNLQDRKKELEKQKKQLEQKQRTETDPAKQKQYRDEAVTLELSYQKVNGKYEENRSVMEQLLEQETAVFNQEVTKQQGESMKKSMQDVAKIMEVARRIARGAKVPVKDEKKLMEYNMELYMAAKNAAAIMELQKKDKKKYDSLWKDKEEVTRQSDLAAVAEQTECAADIPETDAAAGEM